MNCEDVPMSEWDKLTGAEQEALEAAVTIPECCAKGQCLPGGYSHR